MKMNLRKAHAITMSISEYMATLSLGSTFSVDDTVDVTAVITEKTEEFLKNVTIYMTAQEVLYSIRQKISGANLGEINNLVHELAFIDARIKTLTQLSSKDARDEDKVILARVEKLKAGTLVTPKVGIYDRQEIQTDVKVSALTKVGKDAILNDLANLRLKKTALKQSLLEENIKASITLDDSEVTFLQSITLLSK